MDIFPCGFPISSNKKGGKSKLFFFFGSEENENKKKNFFEKIVFLLQRAFSLFFVGNLPEKMIRKCFGGKEKK